MNIYIGVDGGGTKTEAVAADSAGNVLSRYSGGSTNQYVVTFDGAMKELSRVLDSLLAPLPKTEMICGGACLGMSGISSDNERQRVSAFLQAYQQERGLPFPFWLVTEAEISLMAALRQEYGILVISGTGSNTYGITRNGKRYRAGGWGHILGDEGSGYMIGMLTLKAIIKSHEGITPPTIMTERILEAYSFKEMTDLKAYIYGPSVGKSQVASFAQFCIEAAGDGDPAAIHILREQAEELAETAAALIAREPELETEDVVMTGSVFKYSAVFRDAFREALIVRYPRLSFPEAQEDLSPAHGAALLAGKLGGGEILIR